MALCYVCVYVLLCGCVSVLVWVFVFERGCVDECVCVWVSGCVYMCMGVGVRVSGVFVFVCGVLECGGVCVWGVCVWGCVWVSGVCVCCVSGGFV